MDCFQYENARFSIRIARSAPTARWQLSMLDRMCALTELRKSIDGALSLEEVKELAVLELLPTVVECDARSVFSSRSMQARHFWAYPRLWRGRGVVCQFLVNGEPYHTASSDALRRSHVMFASRLVDDVLGGVYLPVSANDPDLSDEDQARNIAVINSKSARCTSAVFSMSMRSMRDSGAIREAITSAADIPQLEDDDRAFVRTTAQMCYQSSDYRDRKTASFVEAYCESDLYATLGKSRSLSATGRRAEGLWQSELESAIRKPTGYSFLRAGEGEGCFLAYRRYAQERIRRNEAYGVIAKDIYNIWFRENIHDLGDVAYTSLVADFMSAVKYADYIGVPSQSRIIYEFKSLSSDLRRYGHSRGYLGVQALVNELLMLGAEGKLKACVIGDCDVARPLYNWQNPGDSLATVLPRALYQSADVVVISCHQALAELLGRSLSIARVESIRIPGEKGRIDEKYDLVGSHLHDHYQSVLNQCDRLGGRTVLVAAGFLGKMYCARIKRAGGTAIDIGSLADFWMGQRTRAKAESIARSPFPAPASV